jgi:hypothetical protein
VQQEDHEQTRLDEIEERVVDHRMTVRVERLRSDDEEEIARQVADQEDEEAESRQGDEQLAANRGREHA